jgi:hypothetical protein
MEIIDPSQTPSAPVTPEPQTTDEIRSQIEQTRDGMSQTIDEIQARLTPSHLVGQAVDAAKSTAQDAASGAAEQVAGAAQTATNATVEALTQLLTMLRNSPAFMAALPGLIAALLNSGRMAVEGAEHGVERAGEQARHASMAMREAASALWESIRQNPALMGALVSGLTWLLAQGTNAMTKASEARQKAAEVAGQAGETAGALTEQARESAGELGAQAQQQVREQAQRAAGWLQRAVEQNPLVVALAAVAIGAAIGLSSKPTQLEQHVMGPARDRLLEQAQQLAKGLATTAAATAATAMVAHAASQTTPRQPEKDTD